MGEQIDEITIVGGGTAGWLTAAFLIRYMNLRSEEKPTKITLIESPNVPTIGVGEATVPTMVALLASLGISEKEFFKRCNTTFKLGVRFTNWNHDANGNATSFYHPFETTDSQLAGQNPAYHFINMAAHRAGKISISVFPFVSQRSNRNSARKVWSMAITKSI